MIQKPETRNWKPEKLFLIILISGFWLLVSAQQAHAANIIIAGDACANVTATEAPDVEYKPGVDANGKPVAPADLPNSTMPTPQDIQIPLQLKLKKALHLQQNSDLVAPEAVVGTIEYKNGQLTFNGQPISDEARTDIQSACQSSRRVDEQTSGPGGILGSKGKNLLRGD